MTMMGIFTYEGEDGTGNLSEFNLDDSASLQDAAE
jgi:hypothetical protein